MSYWVQLWNFRNVVEKVLDDFPEIQLGQFYSIQPYYLVPSTFLKFLQYRCCQPFHGKLKSEMFFYNKQNSTLREI